MTEKSADAFRTISEVGEWLGTPTHVLRFWESKFSQVRPVKRAGGRRYYRPADMQLLGGIKKLLHEDGMTIKGVQKILREHGIRYVAAMSPPIDHDLERMLEPTTAGQDSELMAVVGDDAPRIGEILPFAGRSRDREDKAGGAVEDRRADEVADPQAAAPRKQTSAPEAIRTGQQEAPPPAEEAAPEPRGDDTGPLQADLDLDPPAAVEQPVAPVGDMPASPAVPVDLPALPETGRQAKPALLQVLAAHDGPMPDRTDLAPLMARLTALRDRLSGDRTG